MRIKRIKNDYNIKAGFSGERVNVRIQRIKAITVALSGARVDVWV